MTVATFAPVIAAMTVVSVLDLTSQLNSRREVIITWPDGTVTPFKSERHKTDYEAHMSLTIYAILSHAKKTTMNKLNSFRTIRQPNQFKQIDNTFY
jgi:hypothetical protein